jgi:hypothetical protein
MLKFLEENKFYENKSKWIFGRGEKEFLGHVVSTERNQGRPKEYCGNYGLA